MAQITHDGSFGCDEAWVQDWINLAQKIPQIDMKSFLGDKALLYQRHDTG